jgi:hypothetical protein
MIYYAKSVLSNGKQPTVQEHLQKVSTVMLNLKLV